MAMKDICEYRRAYNIIRRYVIFTFKHFYGEYIVNGKENIPEDGPVIYAANHLNALMDPLAVISLLPTKRQIVYLARADYFKNKTVRKILLYFKILPAFRMRDGLENLEKNHMVFEKCVDVLNRSMALGIMPEGNQGFAKKIRPLAKGIFRIAFAAQQKFGNGKGVKIVPIGIDYGHYDKFGEHLLINIGAPIEVSDYMKTYEENQVVATNKLRDKLQRELKKLTFDVATDKHYDCFETVSEATEARVNRKLLQPDNTLHRFVSRQKIVRRLITLEKKMPDLLQQLESLSANYRENMKELKLKSWVLDNNLKTSQLWLNFILLFITFPIFAVGFALNFLPFFAPDFILKIFKIKFPGGLGSLRFGLGILTFPLFYFLQGWIIYKKMKGEIWNLLVIIPLQYIFGKFTFQWYKSYITLKTKYRYFKLKRTNSPVLQETEHLQDKIFNIIQSA